MEALCDLLFELSNDDRLSILFELQKEPSKISNLSKTLDFTPQATTRNVTRLVEIGLVRRNESSDYILTPYGSTSINLLEPYLFLTENKYYFNTHLTDKLPSEFLARLGVLRRSKPLNGLMEAFGKIEKIIVEAEEFFWYITNEVLVSTNYYIMGLEALDRGVEFRCIEPIGYRVPQNIVDNISKKVRDALDVHRINGLLLDRGHEKIDIILYMNEKEVAVLAFPELTGGFDYLGFTSSDPKVLNWCKDLHRFYWDKAIQRQIFHKNI